jgi:hypothetical protein
MTRQTHHNRRFPILQALIVACAWLPASESRAQDFNRDSVLDTVVGVPYEGYYASLSPGRGIPEAGAVDVVYGIVRGGPVVPAQHWTLAKAGIPGDPQEGDRFGFAVAWGHFNDDKYDDLAIGIPGRDVEGIVDAGAVVIIHGSANGLIASGASMEAAPRFLQQGLGIPGVPMHGDNFGFSLAAGGQFWHQDYLAIGAPGFSAGSAGDQGRGEVVVLYPGHLNQLWTQVVGTPEPGDWFGYSLATGDWGHTPTDALAIGIPGEDVDGATDAGAVEVLYGEGDGLPYYLSSADAQLLRQSTFVGTTQSHSWFGFSLAAGALTVGAASELTDDLAIGEPLRGVGLNAATIAGAVHVIEGSHFLGALDPASTTTCVQGAWIHGMKLTGVSEGGDLFGFAVSIADGVLVIGAPGKNNGAGSVHILHGSTDGPTAIGAQVLTGTGAGRFGWSVKAVIGHTTDGWGRIRVGSPGSLDEGGAVHVFRPDAAAGTFVPAGTLTQDSIFGASERTEPGDGFGASVGAGGLPRITFTW